MSYFKSARCGTRSNSYRFTVDSLDDASITRLREDTKRRNAISRKSFKHLTERFGIDSPYGEFKKSYVVRIRPRGSRNGKVGALDTPIENATHFDVYVQENLKHRGYDY